MKNRSNFFLAACVMLFSAMLLSACGGDDSLPGDGDFNGYNDDAIYYDVVTTIKYKYQQPGVEDCPVSLATYEATLRYTMPNREYLQDGCGEEYDGILHVLCGNESTSLEVLSSNNGAEWESGDVTTRGDFLSVFRKDGKTWLDFDFSASSDTYSDPNCSGEETSTNVNANTVIFREEGDDYIPFEGEVDMSLGQDFTWKKTSVSDDQCDLGCIHTTEVEVHFIPQQ